MRNEISIKSLLDAVTVPADWVGLREVYESNTPRMIRDGVPVSNGHYSTHGAMVEVLVNGQFGYFGTPDLSKSGIELAARKAYDQAKAASKYALHHFTDEVRPKTLVNILLHLKRSKKYQCKELTCYFLMHIKFKVQIRSLVQAH